MSLFVVSAPATAGCEEEGRLEKAGESADGAIENVGDQVETATE